MAVRFVSAPLRPSVRCIDSAALSAGDPPLPAEFGWREGTFAVADVVRTWRTTKNDRGDDDLARHLRGRPRWWVYTIGDEA